MKNYFIFSIIFFFSCKEEGMKKSVTIRRGDTILKGNIINDTLFNDTIKYYNLNNDLVSVKVFKNGKEDGISTDFYSNGRPMIVASYSNGLKNGLNVYYDSLGKCFYKDFYYYNLIVGPILYFDKEGKPKRYFFSNLQNETLLQIDYEKWNGIRDIYSNCINFTSNTLRQDSTKEIILFLYIIDPPKLSFRYSIFKKKKASESGFVEIKEIKSNLPFAQITLPVLPDDEQYSVGVNIYDSIFKKRSIIYKDF
jgi:hypothetical protein